MGERSFTYDWLIEANYIPRQADYTFRQRKRQMVMHELVLNLHMHTTYSDGFGTHREITQAALNAGVDAVIVTDHNVWVNGPEDIYREGPRRVLLMVGEEIHDQARESQKNHLLVFGAGRELSTLAHSPQLLLEAVARAGGLAFFAHIIDPASPRLGLGDHSWVDWDLHGFTGIELWNAMSEVKSLIRTWLHGLFYAFNPHLVAHGPFPEAIRKWDELLVEGRRVVAIGGSDAHALRLNLGPLKRIIFPYEFHFHCINNHVLVPGPFTGEVTELVQKILEALSRGNAFIGYDLPASTRGFRFTAHGMDKTVHMGDEVSAQNGVTLQIRLPLRTECRLIQDGKVIKAWKNRENCTHITTEPGVYRVEVYLEYYGRRRAWIFSNPIYVR